MVSTQHSALSTLFFRLLLAALLGVASEILLWTQPTRPLIDWALLALGYLALSGLLLEIAARYRLRDAFGLLTLVGIYGMMNGLILNPATALIDVPRTLITRAMGGHAAAGLIALALFLALTRGGLRGRRNLIAALGIALIVGVAWGTWARWSPVEFGGQDASTPGSLALFAGVGVGLIALALPGTRRVSAPLDLRLGAPGWAFTLIVLIGLLADPRRAGRDRLAGAGDHRHTDGLFDHDTVVSAAQKRDDLAGCGRQRFAVTAALDAAGDRVCAGGCGRLSAAARGTRQRPAGADRRAVHGLRLDLAASGVDCFGRARLLAAGAGDEALIERRLLA